MKNALKFASIALGFCLPAVTAHAQFQVVVGQGLVDNKGNPVAQTFKPAPGKPNVIELNDVEIMAKGGVQFLVQGQVTQMVTGHPDPPGIDLRFTRLTIINQSTVANPVTATSSIIVQSDVFKTPIGPPFNGRLHLDGYYRSTGHGAPITNSQVSLSGSLLQPAPAQNIGTLTIPAVKAQNGPVYFGPFHPGDNTATFVGPNPDVTKAFPIGGTQTSITLNFTVGQNDRLVLYGSAFSAAYSADRVFTVNSTLDLPDGFPGDGLCDTGTPTSGPTGICTLRAALTEADFQPVVTAIQFNIPGTGIPKIQMQSDTTFNFGSMGALQTVVIDGTTQPGGLVEVDGSQASPVDAGGSPIVGLDLVGQGSMVLGLLIHSFPSHAIQIRPTGAPFGGSNVVEENAIGTDITGLALPNGGDGVHITQQPNNLVLDNVIANNAGQGVLVDGSAATGNTIHATPIFANGGGISLTNSGNNLQGAPVLTSASEDGANLTIGGTLHSAASQTFNLDFFVNSVCDVSGAGQGTTYLGSTSASTDASGDVTFTAVLPANPSEGLIATATATDTSGNTSQFSACEAVQQVPPTTQPPVANAGSTQTVTVGTLVMLNGSGSFDPNTPPLPLTFQWTQTSGPAVSLTGANTATPSFTPTQTGSYVFSLVVNNGVFNSTAANVTITVNPKAPIANAGSNQTVTVGTLVTLNGSGSSDPNTPPLPLTFKWTQTSGPAVSLTGANTATPSFMPTQTGSYVFSLVVNNGVLDSTAASVTITVTAKAPIANAGSNQTVTVGTLVTLNGNASSDPNTPPLPLTFKWTQTSGPAVTLTGANTATPSFTPTQTGSYVFSLVVNNGVLDSAAASVTITVIPVQPQQLIQSLIAEVQSLGLPKGTEQSLVSKLRAASDALNRGNAQPAINQLGAFIHEVEAQSGKKISRSEADTLIADAEQIIVSIG